MIELKNYSVKLGGKEILKDINFKLNPGESVGIIGASGAGKSLTFRSALGLIEGAKINGEIFYKNQKIETNLKAQLKNSIGYITQDVQNSLNPYIKIVDQMISDLVFAKKLSKKEAEEIALNSLEKIGISKENVKKYPEEFSGGMQQRVVISMILNRNPELLIADEISSALDRESTDLAIDIIKSHIEKTNMSLIYITHNPFDAIELANRICVFKDGKITEDKDANKIFESTDSNTQSLLHAARIIYGQDTRN